MSFVQTQTKTSLTGGKLYKTTNSTAGALAKDDSKIPIVRHIIKDQEVETPEGEQLDPLELDKIIKLFVDPHSSTLIERHLHCIKKISKHYKKGFLMKDVVKIVKLLNILADMIDKDAGYAASMCTLLKLFQYPFMKEKSSDELVFEQLIAECVSNLGYLFRVANAGVRDEITSCILNLVTYQLVPEPYANLKRCNKQFMHKCIKLSDLPETLVKSLTLIEDDITLRVKTIKILQILSRDKTNCEKLLDAECAHRIVLKMNSTTSYQASEELLFRSTETLWNLLEHGDHQRVAEQLNSLLTLSQLRDAFLQQLLQGYSNYDRQLRNDILIISIQLASVMPRLPFIECGFAKDLLLFATYPEVKSHNPLIRNLKLTTCYEDFELKKLFFIFASAISKNNTSYQLLSESGILLALLSFIKPVEQDRDLRDWTKSQFEELQLHAMSTLCQLIPVMLKDYFQCRGSNRLLVFLEWCSNDKNDYIGNGNNFFGSGGRGTKKSQLKYCLRVLRSIVNTSNEQAIQDLTDQDALSTLTRIIKNYSLNEAECDQLDVEIQSDVMFIISCICENDLHRKELFGTDGTTVLLQLMKKKPAQIWNGLGYQRFIIGVVDCIWATIVGSIINEDYFIQSEGIFNLLDIMEVSPKSIQNIILGCILDLCDNPKTLIHMLQWESNDNSKIAHFLCEMWRTEERDIGVERDSNGIIINPSKPLSAGDSEPYVALPSYLPSKSIVEVSENMRGKIYGIFCKLGFNDLSGITNEDQLTLCIIENYLDFKLGEVFREINQELQVEGIEPIPPDQEALDTILRAAEDRAVHVNMNQKYLHNTFMQQEIMQEKEFYYEIKKNFGFKEEKIQEWKNYVSRTSKYNVLVSHKNKQMAAIEDSRPPERDPVPYETIHNLEIPNLAVTAFSGPFIAIDSTPAEITGGRLKKMILR